MVHPSGNPPGPGQVPRTGRHGQVSDVLGGSRANHQGFAVVIRDDGSLEVRWVSRTLNKQDDNFEVPVADRQAIVEKLKKRRERRLVNGEYEI